MNALGSVLRREGYVVQVVRALGQAGQVTADLVLVDAYDRALSAAGVVAAFKRKLRLAQPVCLFGSGVEQGLQALCAHTGADGYICTAWGYRRLLSALRHAAQGPCGGSLEGGRLYGETKGNPTRLLVLDGADPDDKGPKFDWLAKALASEGYATCGCSRVVDLRLLLPGWDPDVIVADVSSWDGVEDGRCHWLQQAAASMEVPFVLCAERPPEELENWANAMGAAGQWSQAETLEGLLRLLSELSSELVT